MTTFEYLCCRIGGGHGSSILVAVYRPGSKPVCDQFFAEFNTLLESLATYNCRYSIGGDFNTHFERPTDRASRNFLNILDMHNLQQYVTEPTHDRGGGLLDAVIAPRDSGPTEIMVKETSLSDHKMVFWTTRVECPLPEFKMLRR